MATKLYPIGMQTFSEIREEDFLYVDKTEYIYRMTHTSGKYFFLARPRRFGKSLLVSTMQSYFEGKKELFKGLAIEKLEKEWTKYPVLHFSLAGGKHMEKDQLVRYLLYILKVNEEKFGIVNDSPDPNVRMLNLIKTVYEQTGQKVVVLIDEYDAPLLDVVHEDTSLDILREVMRNFYSPLKYSDRMLRFVFLTGITKEELLENMSDDIDMLADALGYSREMMIAKLKENYDGYHFSKKSPDVFNPYSLLNCFSKKELGAFWFSSGTPTYLINMLRQFGVLPTEIAPTEAVSSSFNAPTENMKTITPLLYQSGYVTIKEYDPETRIYTLDIPNKEIKVGLFDNLLPNYVDGVSAERGNVAIAKMALLIGKRNMDGALHLLQDFLGTVPYCNVTNYEGHYQQMLFIIFTLLTNYLVDVEVHTPRGRVDIVLLTKTDLYVVELKLNKSAQAAMQQINLKNYRQRFALCGLPITKVGINFDSTQGTIEDWVIGA